MCLLECRLTLAGMIPFYKTLAVFGYYLTCDYEGNTDLDSSQQDFLHLK